MTTICRGALIALCVSVVLLGCMWAQTSGQAPLQSAGQRNAAPDFSLQDSSGKTIHLSDFKRQVVLLDFWAVTCGGCRLEIPWYVEFQDTYKRDGLKVIGVAMDMFYEDLASSDEAWKLIRPFATEQKMNYPIALATGKVIDDFSIEALPATYLIDRNGRMAAAYVGVVADKANVEQNIKKLLVVSSDSR